MSSQFQIGQKVKVFDCHLWEKQGGDIGHNENCWQEAIVMDIHYNVVYTYDGVECIYPELIDVRFHYDNHTSHAHFPEAVKALK